MSFHPLNAVAIFPFGTEYGTEHQYFSRYCIEVRNPSVMTTLPCILYSPTEWEQSIPEASAFKSCSYVLTFLMEPQVREPPTHLTVKECNSLVKVRAKGNNTPRGFQPL